MAIEEEVREVGTRHPVVPHEVGKEHINHIGVDLHAAKHGALPALWQRMHEHWLRALIVAGLEGELWDVTHDLESR